jgi:DnaJ-class molecular chaperone
MSSYKVKVFCSKCVGTGTFISQEGPIVCPSCRGEGKLSNAEVDSTSLEEKLDYIHGKVTAIWNKVKDK